METPSTSSSKSKNKLLKISFHNLPFSPHRIKNRKKNKKVIKEDGNKKAYKLNKNEVGIFESLYGPVSPKISCIGQIKHKKKVDENMNVYFQKEIIPFSTPQPYSKNKSSLVKKPMFFLSEAEKIPSNMRNNNNGRSYDRPICLNQVKRFASCNNNGGALTNFDWRIARMELDHLDEYFEEWKNDYQVDEGEDHYDDDEVVEVEVEVSGIPISAAAPIPAVVGGGGDGGDQDLKPREEINIWERRTIIAKPMPLNIYS